MSTLRDRRRLIQAAAGRGLAPPPERSVAEWADAERFLGPEEGPQPGPWRTSRVPYMRAVMDCLSLAHPSRRVTLMASSQIGKTAILLNFGGQCIAETPATILWVMPSLDEAGQFNREKLEPMLANSPAVARQVSALVSRDEAGSTTRLKRFPGGSLELTGANSSKGLQMRTKRVVILDEVSEFPQDVDGRGDPVAMAEARTVAWTGREKIAAASTPGLKGSCRISARYAEGSMGEYHVDCPHCGAAQPLVMANLRWPAGEPAAAMYHCASCGAGIEHRHKAAMLAAGRWVHLRPELLVVHASFKLNALYSPFVNWAWVADRRDASKDDPLLDKVFTQQVAGEAYEPRYDLPAHDRLHQRRETWPARRIPPGVLFLAGSVDVQGDRLEWAVYGYDRDFNQWWIDGGILAGDPNLDPVWLALDEIATKTWPDAWGTQWPCEAFGCDSGYLPQRVYRWVRRHAHRGQPQIFALDGRPKWGLPPLGSPSSVDVDFNGKKIGTAQIWPVGTWDLKTELAAALRLTEMGPDDAGAWPRGAMRFPQALSLDFFEQMTSEACVEIGNRAGFSRREWHKVRPRNEQWDLAVYSRALARHLTAAFADAEWNQLAAKRLGPAESLQGDLALLWTQALKAEATPPAANPTTPGALAAPEPPPARQHGAFIEARDDWF